MEKENSLEWINRTDSIAFTLNQVKFKNKVMKLAEENEAVKYVQNSDGSITGSFPVSFLKIDAPKHRNLSEEQRKNIAKRFERSRKKRGN